jgi:predicted amino acid-binding ACT domain protein
MAYFGAKGLQIRTILPAKEKGILIRIKNTFNPSAEGTVICDSTDREMGVTKAVLSTKNVSMLTVKGDVLKGGALSARVLTVLEQLKVVPLMISQSVSSASISVVLPRPMTDIVVRGLEREVIGELGGGELEVERDVAAIAVIGEGMKGTPGVASKVFTAVAKRGINVRMIAQGSSELNISFVVKERDSEEAVRAVREAHELLEARGVGLHQEADVPSQLAEEGEELLPVVAVKLLDQHVHEVGGQDNRVDVAEDLVDLPEVGDHRVAPALPDDLDPLLEDAGRQGVDRGLPLLRQLR